MNSTEFNELLARAVSRGLKEGIEEKQMNALEMIGALDYQKTAIVAMVLDNTKKAAQPRIVPAPPGLKIIGHG